MEETHNQYFCDDLSQNNKRLLYVQYKVSVVTTNKKYHRLLLASGKKKITNFSELLR